MAQLKTGRGNGQSLVEEDIDQWLNPLIGPTVLNK